jgi:hypothetical protein
VTAILLGLGCAFLASALYGVQLAVQALDARTVQPEHGYRLSLLGRVAGRRRWIAGNVAGALGWPLQVVALMLAPLTLVQPALGVGLVGLLLAAARRFGEPVDRRLAGAVAAMLGGLAVAVAVAPPRSAEHAAAPLLAVVLAALAALALVPYAVPALRRGGLAGACSAGLAFAFGSIVTKLCSDAVASRHPLAAAGWFVLVLAAAGVGILSEMSAFQQRPVAQVVPTAFAIEALVPLALAPVLVGEHWPSGGHAAILAGALALVVAGAVALERSAPIANVVAARHDHGPTSAAPRPDRPRAPHELAEAPS